MKSRRFFLGALIAMLSAFCYAPRQAHAVQFLVTYADADGTGFLDANLGAQRKAAFEAAVSYWAQHLQGNVPLEIKATFGAYGASSTEATLLAQAGPTSTRTNFVGALLKDTQYPIALANEMAGIDLAPAPGTTLVPSYEIEATFNSDLDKTTNSQKYYYGLDSNPPVLGTDVNGNPLTDVDFYTTAIHELAHGLGFASLISSSGVFLDDVPSTFDRLMANNVTPTATRLTSMLPAKRAAALISNSLFFAGPSARRGDGSGFNVRLYAPLVFEQGSSVSHLDEDTYHGINEMMTPYDSGAVNQAGPVALGVMADIGWTVADSASLPLPTSVTPTPPAASGRIAYSVGGDIFVMNADGTNKLRVTSGLGNDTQPTISENGDKIVFVSNRDGGDQELYVVNTDGSNLRRLTSTPGSDTEPSFSPDGNSVLFTSLRSNNSDIWMLNLNTGALTNLTAASTASESQGAFNHDGDGVTFVSTRDGNAEIYVMGSDGSNPTRLTTDAATAPYVDSHPAFSRDDTTIVFSSTRDGNEEIYTVPAAGGTLVRQTQNLSVDTTPTYSPFQDYIVYSSNLNGNMDIWTQAVRATATDALSPRYRLTTGSEIEIQPSWGGANDAAATPTPSPSPSPSASPTPTPSPTPNAGPPNDDFANAATASDGRSTGTNVNADKETGERDHGGNAGGSSVWYKWTAAQSGTVSIDTMGSDFDTTLAVYTGTDVAHLTLIAQNDDTTGTATSRVIFRATSGTTYYIAVDGFGGKQGNVVLNIAVTSGPANDKFADATNLTTPSGTVNGDTNVNATKEGGEGPISGSNGGASVWYVYNATSSGRLTVSTRGSSFDTLLAAYDGTTVSQQTPVAQNDNETPVIPTSLIAFDVTAGQAYHIKVDGFGGTTGNIVLTYTLSAAAKPDAIIGLGTATVGDDIYNTTAVNQEQPSSTTPGGTTTFALKFQNDGTSSVSLRIKGDGAAAGTDSVRYYAGALEKTSEVTGAGYLTPVIPVGGAVDMTMTVDVNGSANVGTVHKINVNATSTSTGLAVGSDTVRAVVTVSTPVVRAGTTNKAIIVPLSSGKASASKNEVELRFASPLNAAMAGNPGHYDVSVLGTDVPVNSATYDAAANTVHLFLEPGIVHRGNPVQVTWSGLVDAKGNFVAPNLAIFPAK